MLECHFPRNVNDRLYYLYKEAPMGAESLMLFYFGGGGIALVLNSTGQYMSCPCIYCFSFLDRVVRLF